MSAYFGAAANGIYTAAYTIVLEPVRAITNVVNDVAFPTFVRIRTDAAKVGAQFIRFTRLNLIAVLPFLLLVALVIPDFIDTFWRDGKWKDHELEMIIDGTRILCFVGMLRALGFLGPPLLDGLGRPGLTLRYTVSAAVLTTGGYVICAELLGDRSGPLSVAIAWATFYPLAFLILAYIVMKTIRLSPLTYLRETWGLVASAVLAGAVGFGVHVACAGLVPWLRLVVTLAVAIGVLAVLLDRWQGVSLRSLKSSMQ